MKALILAGGKGTRLGEKTQLTPKPMLLIGGKPVLQHQVELFKGYGITDITLLVNHLSTSIIQHFGDGNAFGVSITYYNEREPLGTAGGIKDLENDLTDDFLLLYGDVMVNMDLNRLIDFHKKAESDCTLVVHPNDHPQDSDLVEIDDQNRVVAFHPKPHDEGKFYRNLVNAGLYLMNPSVLQFIKKGRKADFGHDIFPAICKKINMLGYNTAEYLKDMGTPTRFERVTADYLSGRIERASYRHKRTCIYLDRDGVLNEDTDLISRHEDLNLFDFVPEAIKRINQSEYLSVVITNQSVVARNLCTYDDVKVIHNKMEALLGEAGAYLNDIYFCPHHPDGGFPGENVLYKVNCKCRKPKPGMLLDAAEKFNIDLEKSWMVGDSDRDIKAGKAAGCRTIAVRTGRSTHTSKVNPDYWFENLTEAVSFIIDNPYSEIVRRVDEDISKSGTNPFVIAIGGRARSGKSSLSKYLTQWLEDSKKKVLHVELDKWLLPESDRVNAKNVFDRYQLPLLIKDLVKLLNGQKVIAPGYSIDPKASKEAVEYNPMGFDVIILDGVIGLSMPEVREQAQLKIFVNIDSGLHKQRFFDYYRWRGKSESEIFYLLNDRLLDENKLIDRNIDFADIVV
ncbi:MAG: HAD-IIIA family hydrolase [Bacteroidales bacterium]|nr:MAG: HAD-IIIA family hydrolase [Bacteroidales bacterium]